MRDLVFQSTQAGNWPILLGAIAIVITVVLAWILHRQRTRLRGLQRLARRRGMRLVELSRLVSMAESSAQLGLWHYYPNERRQEWSGGMKQLFGLESDMDLLEGDAETLLASNEVDLVSHAMNHSHGHEVSSSNFMIRRWDGSRRILQFQTCHLGQGKGELDRVLGVLADVTDQIPAVQGSLLASVSEARPTHKGEQTEPVDHRRLLAELDRHVIAYRKEGTPVALLLVGLGGGPKMRRSAEEKLRSEFAMITGEHLRSNDMLGQVDISEFAWLAAGADEHFAQLVAERLRCAFAIGGLAGMLGDDCIDIGITAARDGDTALSMFARADGALDRSRRKSKRPLLRVA